MFKYTGAGFYKTRDGEKAYVGCCLLDSGFEGDICLLGWVLDDVCKNVGWRINGKYLSYPDDESHGHELVEKLEEPRVWWVGVFNVDYCSENSLNIMLGLPQESREAVEKNGVGY